MPVPPVTVIILAGQRAGVVNPLAARAGVSHKCLVPIGSTLPYRMPSARWRGQPALHGIRPRSPGMPARMPTGKRSIDGLGAPSP